MTPSLEIENQNEVFTALQRMDPEVQLDLVLPEQALGFLLASCGLRTGDEQGPPAMNSKER